MSSSELPDHVLRNRAYWTREAVEYARSPQRNWSSEPNWGIWSIPEGELGLLGDVSGKDVLDLGCGTGYWSAWLTRMGARPVGIDITPAQLETARAMQAEFGIEFPLIEANAEAVPLPDESFDLVLSEYGASIWCDPYRWVPEAARLLRPGGELVFLRNSTLIVLCFPEHDAPALTELQRDYFGLHRLDFPQIDESVNFQLGHGDWIRVLRANGFEILDLVEIRAPDDAEGVRYNMVDADWARRWPSEEIWKARKRG
jgi:ubiquinone/menaquinone biosynthesis C-methylase UbiE